MNGSNIKKLSIPKILIVEDATGVASMYKTLLKEKYKSPDSIVICKSGEDTQKLIENGLRFDLTLMDIVLPPEDLEKFRLEDCGETGLRLINNMLTCNTCQRFYVITVLKEMQARVEELCKGKGAVLKFEHKLDHEPEKLIENVVTHEKFRRKGYATEVLKNALAYAWKNRCYKTMLLTGSKNPGIHDFYEKVGFRKDIKMGFNAKNPDIDY